MYNRIKFIKKNFLNFPKKLIHKFVNSDKVSLVGDKFEKKEQSKSFKTATLISGSINSISFLILINIYYYLKNKLNFFFCFSLNHIKKNEVEEYENKSFSLI